MYKLKKSILGLTEAEAIQAAARWWYDGKYIVLMYHGVCDNTACQGDWLQLPVAVFEEQMEYLANHCDVVSLMDAINDTPTRRNHRGPKVVITFDDGYYNNYEYAYPILKRLNLPATIFLVTDFINTDRLFWYDRLQTAVAPHVSPGKVGDLIASFKRHHPRDVDYLVDKYLDDMEFVVPADAYRNYSILDLPSIREMAGTHLISYGSHTASHELLTNLDTFEEITTTLRRSKFTLEGVPNAIPVICYPNGWYNSQVIEAAEMLGYKAGIRAERNDTGIWEPPEHGSATPQIPRWGIGQDTTLNRFASIVSGSIQALTSLSGKRRNTPISGA